MIPAPNILMSAPSQSCFPTIKTLIVVIVCQMPYASKIIPKIIYNVFIATSSIKVDCLSLSTCLVCLLVCPPLWRENPRKGPKRWTSRAPLPPLPLFQISSITSKTAWLTLNNLSISYAFSEIINLKLLPIAKSSKPNTPFIFAQ